jgi:FkbM family methyltransferase
MEGNVMSTPIKPSLSVRPLGTLAHTSAQDPLAELLNGPGIRERALAREANAFDSIAGDAKNTVIVGCGHLGKVALSGALEAGLPVVALADNNSALWGQTVSGVPVLSPQDAIARYDNDAFFVAAIYNGTPLREQLLRLGCTRVVPYPVFYWQFSKFISALPFWLPHRILDRMDDVRQGYNLLSDEKSRQEFAAQIQWRCSLDYSCLPTPSPGADMYYDPSLVRLSPQEVLADCGAFDGDSVRMFLDKVGHQFRHIYALEPDPRNRAALSAFAASLPVDEAERISVLPFAVSDFTGVTSFNVTGTAGSTIASGAGAETVECRRLEDLFDGPAPTFVKMDIEGAEPSAIRGATGLIRKARPILAVCAYHQCEHLWTLPVLLKTALPEYELFFRRYAEECWETVYYAIPPERAIPSAG